MKIKGTMLMKLSTNMNNICSIPNIYDNRVLLLQTVPKRNTAFQVDNNNNNNNSYS